MYIKREPLGKGNLAFRKRRRRYPLIAIVLYMGVLAASVYVFLRADQLRPRVEAMIGPPPAPTATFDEIHEIANNSFMAGELDLAADYYRRAAELDPKNAELHAELARVLTYADRYDEALEVSEQAILIAPEDPAGYAAKAFVLDWSGRPADAVVEALRAIELDPDYAMAHAYLAEAYTDLGRLRQALEQAELAIELDPYNVESRRTYAYVLEFYGDYSGAVQQYQQAIQLHPELLQLYYGLARNYRGNGQIDEAVATFQQIILRTPQDPLPRVGIGRTYFEIRDDAAAQENFQQAVELVCQDCPLYSGDDYLEGVVPANRDLPDYIFMPAWTRLGQVYLTRRNYEDAVGIMEEAIAWAESQDREDPDYQDVPIEAYYVAATAYYYIDKDAAGNPMCDRAIELTDAALRLYERERLEDPFALDNILSVYVLCRDYANTQATSPVIFPDGYEEPCVLVSNDPDVIDPCAPDAGGDGEDVQDADAENPEG